MRIRASRELLRRHLARVSFGLAAIAVIGAVVGLGFEEAVGDEAAWAALEGGGAFLLLRHGTAERRNDPRLLSTGNCAR